MAKQTNAAGENWFICDTKREGYNAENNRLLPDASSTESTDSPIDILSNGFKLRNNNDNRNMCNIYICYVCINTYIYTCSNKYIYIYIYIPAHLLIAGAVPSKAFPASASSGPAGPRPRLARAGPGQPRASPGPAQGRPNGQNLFKNRKIGPIRTSVRCFGDF